MKVIFRNRRIRKFLKRSQQALFACALVLLGYCGFARVDSWLFQRRASQDLDRLLRARHGSSVAGPRRREQAAGAKVAPVALPHGLIGRIAIPRLRVSDVVMEGIDTKTLRRAVGHIPGTAMPGDAGNVGLAGHRDTFFRPLKNVRIKDEIDVSTGNGSFAYEVVSLKAVGPENVGVLAPSGEHVLTLVTCYPFYYVGPAPQRWIVRARQVSSPTPASSNVK